MGMEFWVCCLAQRCQELLHVYKSLKFKIFKIDFPLLGICRSWEVLSVYCSHGLRALASVASTGWMQHRGTCPVLGI